MRVDLKKLFQPQTAPAGTGFSLDVPAEDFPGYRLAGPVTGHWSAELQYDRVVFSMDAAVTIRTECARCLDPIERSFAFSREWKFRPHELEDPDFELPLDEDGCLDVDELIFQEVVIEVPTVLLCSPDCVGLCPICGKKKEAGCTCRQAESAAPVDARLAILQKLLN